MAGEDVYGSYAWTRSTAGVMSSADRRHAIGPMAEVLMSGLIGNVRFRMGRTSHGLSFDDLRVPDSPLAVEATRACAELNRPDVLGHSYRTWAYGRALAAFDGARLDEELFYVACLLHDYGLPDPRAGEDFTLRGAECARRCARTTGRSEATGTTLADAITFHVTPGVDAYDRVGLGCYVQAGSMLDLAGLRAVDVSRAFLAAVAGEYDRSGVTEAFIRLVKAEAAKNPGTRFGLLNRCGLTLTFCLNPLRPR
ncbi:hypothetical protein Ait01nite_014340 [Actinoplanes italicus]|uniref:HD domain-containing protein n=1 Tax=Actinoplanes italicus TaxID=113567 RepID=A0A2T0KHH1_9ACTN|nr:HD domain-containing protein [Actinoplanes italicus]PRX22868.1 HD domain-containing protein [Actinoplanes italicus]GIE28389.1 hypothetical protein Ait01nite_014340 [Actinoplanes italicus]